MNLNRLLKYNEFLRSQNNIDYLTECRNYVTEKSVMIIYSGHNNALNLVNFYSERLKIQSITRSKSIIDYNELLLKLEKVPQNQQFDIVHLYTQNFGFIILHSQNEVFHILKNFNMTLEKLESYDKQYSEKNFEKSPFVKILKGTVVESNINNL